MDIRTVRSCVDADRRARGGFTLIEMLVAMAVFSLAALALLNLAGENTRSAARVETRVLGGVIAENLAVQAFVLPNPPAYGETRGETAMAGRTWRWVQTVARTAQPGVIRIDVQVLDGAETAATLTVFRDTGA